MQFTVLSETHVKHGLPVGTQVKFVRDTPLVAESVYKVVETGQEVTIDYRDLSMR